MLSPFKTILLFVLTALIGWALVPRLSVDLQPSTMPPALTVTASLPHAPPETVEQEVTAPLENAFSALPQLKSIYSISHYGSSTIELSFDRHADMALKKFEVSSAIRQLYPRLNPGVSFPTVEQRTRTNARKNPLLIYRINARLAPYQIRQLTEEKLAVNLRQINGVHDVQISGAERIRVIMAFDPARLLQFGLTPEDFRNVITREFGTSFPGAVYTAAGEKFSVQLSHPVATLSELENAPLNLNNGVIVPLKKLVSIYLEEDPPRQLFRINGRNSISLSIYSDERVNRLALAGKLKQAMDELRTQLPQGFEVQLDVDDTEFLSRELRKNTFRAGLSMGILILFIMISYRSLSYLLILFSGIFISLGITALFANLLNISIHLYTIAGLTISFGLLLDNAIVVMDHLYRRPDGKIGLAVMGATLTTLIALLVILFLPEDERANLTEFSVIVSLALGSSVLTALFYTPAVFVRFNLISAYGKRFTLTQLRRRVRMMQRYGHFITLLVRYRKLVWVVLILMFGLPIFLLPTSLPGYEWYNQTLGSEWYQDNLRPYVDRFTGGALRLFIRNVYERSGYREPERTRLYVYAELPQGHTLQDMDRIMQDTEGFLSDAEGVENFITQIYSGQHASITVSFTPAAERSAIPFQLKARLIARSLDWGGVQWNIFGVGQGFSNASWDNLPSFRVEMTGYNYRELERQATILANKLLEHKRIQQVNTNERLNWDEKAVDQWVLSLNHSKIQEHHINGNTVVNALQWTGERPTPDLQLALNNRFIPLYIVPLGDKQPDIFRVLNEPLRADKRKAIQPGSVAEFKKEKTASAIHKKDRQYIRIVGFEYYGSHKFGNEFLDEKLKEMENEMPVGYSAKKISWTWSWEKVKRQYSLLLILFTGVFLVCAILFESLKQPLLIMGIIPFSFIGLFLTFAWGELYFDQGGYAAFFLVGGLAVNSAIFVVNDFNGQRIKNHNRAVLKAVTGKLRPVLLTTLSTCLGLTPFLIGGQHEIFWYALAAGTIGGLMFSVLLIVTILPVWMFKKSNLNN
ncbi:MAG: efflux RND transporter permease subunit [Cyclobacteriaceae bacterium]|nr:efflux RND transporter permease subunit [Cyclobacteriaceae bacterium]